MEWKGMFILQRGAVMATLDSAALDHAADSCIFVGETKKRFLQYQTPSCLGGNILNVKSGEGKDMF